jgi:hypothetical protein
MSDSTEPSTAFFCQLFGHEWVPRLGLGLECTRCNVFASEDGRVWPSRPAYEAELTRALPAMREAFVKSRVGGHAYDLAPEALLGEVKQWLVEQGFAWLPPQTDAAPTSMVLLKSEPQEDEGGRRTHLVCRAVESEPGHARLRVQRHILTPGFVTKFDSLRASDVELALAERLDARALESFKVEAAELFRIPERA